MLKYALGLTLSAAVLFGGCAPVVSEQARKNARVHYDLGAAAMQQGDINEALREFSIANKNDGRMPETHNALGLAYHAKGQSKEALHHYQKALELRKDFPEARNNYAVLLMDLGRYAEAAKEFENIMEDVMYPTPHFAEANLGWCCYKQGDNENAIAHLRNALAADSNFCRGYLWLATVYEAEKKLPNAIKQMEFFYSRCAENREIRKVIDKAFLTEADRQMGFLLLQNGETERAKQYFASCAGAEHENGTLDGLCTKALKRIE